MSITLDRAAFVRAMRDVTPFLTEAAFALDIRPRAARIAKRAAELAPVGGADDPHAGRLRDDIGVKGEGIDDRGAYVEAGTTVPEGFMQEYGTVVDPPRPFMRPAIAEEGAL